MTFAIYDRVLETTITTGTGDIALIGAVNGYNAFSAKYTIGQTLWYGIVGNGEYETGIGTYSAANTLTRTTVLESSNSGALVAFSTGEKQVFVDLPASRFSGLFTNTGKALISTGDFQLTIKTVAELPWVMCDDGTIGDASSNATTRANADTLPLFTLLWNIPIAYTPIFTSTGSVSTRGSSAAIDFAAHKRISLTKMLGRALVIAGTGSGLTARALGNVAGEENHTLAAAELPVSGYSFAGSLQTWTANQGFIGFINNSQQASSGSGTLLCGSTSGTNIAPTTTITPAGTVTVPTGGNGHNNMQPSSFVNVMILL